MSIIIIKKIQTQIHVFVRQGFYCQSHLLSLELSFWRRPCSRWEQAQYYLLVNSDTILSLIVLEGTTLLSYILWNRKQKTSAFLSFLGNLKIRREADYPKSLSPFVHLPVIFLCPFPWFLIAGLINFYCNSDFRVLPSCLTVLPVPMFILFLSVFYLIVNLHSSMLLVERSFTYGHPGSYLLRIPWLLGRHHSSLMLL